MNLFGTSTNNKHSRGVVLFAIVNLLFLYLIGTVELVSFHAILHESPNDVELHSYINEGNTCHQTAYHNKKNQQCQHKSHIAPFKKCPLCDLSIQSFQLYNSKPVVKISILSKQIEGEIKVTATGEIYSISSPRAPPID